MADINLRARDLTNPSDLSPHARWHVRNALIFGVIATVGLTASICLREVASPPLDTALSWQPPASDYR